LSFNKLPLFKLCPECGRLCSLCPACGKYSHVEKIIFDIEEFTVYLDHVHSYETGKGKTGVKHFNEALIFFLGGK